MKPISSEPFLKVFSSQVRWRKELKGETIRTLKELEQQIKRHCDEYGHSEIDYNNYECSKCNKDYDNYTIAKECCNSFAENSGDGIKYVCGNCNTQHNNIEEANNCCLPKETIQ